MIELIKSLAWIKTFRSSGKVKRAHAVTILQDYRISDHVFNSVMIAMELCNIEMIDSSEIVKVLMVHDTPELYTGDIPGNVKWGDEKFKEELAYVEIRWSKQNIPPRYLNVVLRDLQCRIVEISDSLELVYFCIDEFELGNRSESFLNMSRHIYNHLLEVEDSSYLSNMNSIRFIISNVLSNLKDKLNYGS